MTEIEKKYQSLGGTQGSLGNPTTPEKAIGKGRYRVYQHGRIYWFPETEAHVVIDQILACYLSKGGPNGFLGFPITDEFAGHKPNCSVQRFEGGVIYQAGTGVHEVHGPILLRYLASDGEAGFLGLPKSDETNVPGGRKSDFEGGSIFWSSQSGAHEVHGKILQHYVALKATASFLGFPISDEEIILAQNGKDSGGRLSRFQGGTIYWSGATGAFEVHGYIRELYEKLGGPLGKMGYPLTNETPSAGSLIRYNNFQNGIIVWRSDVGAREITTLRLFIGQVTCGKIDDGIDWFKKDKTPELITYLTVKVNGKTIIDNVRRPSGHGGTSRNVDYEFKQPKVQANTTIYWKVKVDDWDKASGNDYLGTREETYNIKNFWGILGGAQGLYNDKPAQKKGGDLPSLGTLKFDYSIQPVEPLDPKKHFREQFWWRFDNFKTAVLSRDMFAETFRDVEHVDHWWDKLMSPVDWAIYEACYKKLAAKGNCFGMCLASVYTRAGRTPLMEPLYQYKASGDKTYVEEADVPLSLRQPINHYHGYQLGDAAVRWYVSRLANLEAIHPLMVYSRVKSFLATGDYPIVSMFNLSSFSGHAVLPYRCIDGKAGQPHKILVADPNVPWRILTGDDASYIEINQNNTFKMISNGNVEYKSESTLGGMIPTTFLMELPYHQVASDPRTPFWEIILGLTTLLGGVLILIGDAESSQIGCNGKNYYDIQSGKKHVSATGLPNFQRVPFLDYDGRIPELYAQVGRFPDSLVQQIKGVANGVYKQYLRNARGGVELTVPVSSNARDELTMDTATMATPLYHLKTSQTPKMANVDYFTTLDLQRGDYRRFTTGLQAASGVEAIVGMEADTGHIILKPSGPARPLNVSIESRIGGQVKKSQVDYTPPHVGELIVLSPDWSAPGRKMVIERMTGLKGTVIERKEISPR